MTGAEHYAEAEKLIDRADRWLNADGFNDITLQERGALASADAAAAQVHATLAQAAAVLLVGLVPTSTAPEFHRQVTDMRRAIGVYPAAPVEVPA